jgi:hypothetical protein
VMAEPRHRNRRAPPPRSAGRRRAGDASCPDVQAPVRSGLADLIRRKLLCIEKSFAIAATTAVGCTNPVRNQIHPARADRGHESALSADQVLAVPAVGAGHARGIPR